MITIEEGKFYRTRDGRKIGPLARIAGELSRVGPLFYAGDGLWFPTGDLVGKSGWVDAYDLVAEWVDETSQQEGDRLLAEHQTTRAEWDEDLIGRISVAKDREPVYAPVGMSTARLREHVEEAWRRVNAGQQNAVLGGPQRKDDPAYEPLRRVLEGAYEQSAGGKGRERHANNRPFLKQPIMENARQVGLGGPAFQVMKKTQEAVGMAARGQHDRAIAEMRGAIVYAAACILLLEEQN